MSDAAVMEQAIKLFSKTVSQVKDLSVASSFLNKPDTSVTSTRQPVGGSGSDESVLPSKSLSLPLGNRIVAATPPGTVVNDASGLLQEYILNLEDSVICFILEYRKLSDLADIAGVMVHGTIKACNFKDHKDLNYMYSLSSIGVIRMCIRLILRHNTANHVSILDNILGKLVSNRHQNGASLNYLSQNLRNHSTSLHLLQKHSIDVFPLYDDPFVDVFHISKKQLPKANSNEKSSINMFGVTLIQCGSTQVRGLFVPQSNVDHPVYRNKQGYMILRGNKSFKFHYDASSKLYKYGLGPMVEGSSSENSNSASDASSDNHDAMQLYVWYLINPLLSTTYYFCPTIEASVFPPSSGWRTTGQGKMPPPLLQVVPVDQSFIANFESSIVNTGSADSDNSDSHPLLATSFPTISEDDTQSRVSHTGVDLTNRIYRKRNSVDASRECVVFEEDGGRDASKRPHNDVDLKTLKSRSIIHWIELTREIFQEERSAHDKAVNLHETKAIESRRQADELLQQRVHATASVMAQKIDNCKSLFLDQMKKYEEKLKWIESAPVEKFNYGYDCTEPQEQECALSDSFLKKWSISSLVKDAHDATTKVVSNNRQKTKKKVNQVDDFSSYNPNLSRSRSYEEVSEVVVTSARRKHSDDDVRIKSHRKTSSDPSLLPDLSTHGSPSSGISKHQLDQNMDYARGIDLPKQERCLAELLEMAVPHHYNSNPFKVEVLGVEMWPPFKGDKRQSPEKLCYVIRVVLNDIMVVSKNTSTGNLQSSTTDSMDLDHKEAEITQSESSKASPHIARAIITSDSKDSLDTNIRRSIFVPFANELLRRIESRVDIDSRHIFTFRRDLQSLCAFHTELSQLLHGYDIIAPPFPDPFHMATVNEDVVRKMYNSDEGKRSLREGQPYLYNSQNSLLARAKLGSLKRGDPAAALMNQCMISIEEYIQGVFGLVEFIDDHGSDAAMAAVEGSSHTNFKSLRQNLGQLIGNLLQATDLEDIINIKKLKAADTQGDSVLAGKEISGRFSSSVDALRFYRPCWFPFATSGIKLYVSAKDDQGGRLSSKSDDELLRLQRGKCLGCGEPLVSGFFGLDKNFQPCRFHGGLFCKRWCHNDDHRIIPHRLLLYWDTNQHRVSRQAAAYLDDTWSKPSLKLSSINPLLYEGVPSLRIARNLRSRICLYLDSIMATHAEQIKEAIVSTIGVKRLYIVISEELYSMCDITEAHTGSLLISLKELHDYCAALCRESKALGLD